MLKSYMRSSCTGHPHLLSGAETESSMSIKKKKEITMPALWGESFATNTTRSASTLRMVS